MDKLIMIKYGELSTKKDNIKVFIEKLHNNIKRKLKDYDITITKNKVRMFIDIKDNDETIIIKKLKEVFGLEDINELPILYNISWYEQKAVIVLLALLYLGVKN